MSFPNKFCFNFVFVCVLDKYHTYIFEVFKSLKQYYNWTPFERGIVLKSKIDCQEFVGTLRYKKFDIENF